MRNYLMKIALLALCGAIWGCASGDDPIAGGSKDLRVEVVVESDQVALIRFGTLAEGGESAVKRDGESLGVTTYKGGWEQIGRSYRTKFEYRGDRLKLTYELNPYASVRANVRVTAKAYRGKKLERTNSSEFHLTPATEVAKGEIELWSKTEVSHNSSFDFGIR